MATTSDQGQRLKIQQHQVSVGTAILERDTLLLQGVRERLRIGNDLTGLQNKVHWKEKAEYC